MVNINKSIIRLLPFLGPAFNLPGGISPTIIFSLLSFSRNKIGFRLLKSLILLLSFSLVYLLINIVANKDINIGRYITASLQLLTGIVIIYTYKEIYTYDTNHRTIYKHFSNFIIVFILILIFDILNGDTSFFFLQDKQDLSILHGNANNQALFILIAYCLAYSSNCKRESILLFTIGLTYSLFISARLVSALIIVQAFYFLSASHLKRKSSIIFHIIIFIVILILYFKFENNLIMSIATLQEDFERGNIYSDSLRLHYTLEMIDIVKSFDILQHATGIGFGQLSITDPYTNYNFASPHNVYLELYITGGIFIYWILFYYPIFYRKNKINSLITLLTFSPTLIAIITLSSGIYYFGFYLLISLLSYKSGRSHLLR